MTDLLVRDLTSLPFELIEAIFRYLTAADLSRVALCSRGWRCAANQDVLWRPLCRRSGWEHYGTVTDLRKEIPYRSSCPHNRSSGVRDGLSFPMDAIVTDADSTGLTATCKWKEIYMKAHHLESNWENNRCHVVSLKIFGEDANSSNSRLYVRGLDGDGDCFVLGLSNGTIKVWDIRQGRCEHVIPVKLCRHLDTLHVRNGIIVAGCAELKIRSFCKRTGAELQVMEGHKGTDIQRIFFDGETIVSRASFDNDVRVWSVVDGLCRHVLGNSAGAVNLEEMDSRDKVVATAYSDNCLRLWDAESGDCIQTLTHSQRQPSTKLGDGVVASVLNDVGRATLKVWSTRSGECRQSLSLGDLENTQGCIWIEKWFCNGGVLLGSLLHRNHEGIYLNTQNQRIDFVAQRGYTKPTFCCHGNKFVIFDRYNYDDNICHIYKASATGLQLTSSLEHKQEHKVLAVWMDDTKIVFRDVALDMTLYIYHYW